MRADAYFGETAKWNLSHAILVYSGGNGRFTTLHEVSHNKRTPSLGPANPLTTAFLKELSEGLGMRMVPEILPEAVLTRTPEMVVWWTPASVRSMFWQSANNDVADLDGRRYPQPPLLWRVRAGQLAVRALAEERRPTADTRLYVAPFWNTYNDGNVCLGSSNVPVELTIDTLNGWVDGFFNSRFSHHSSGHKLTRFPGGALALWRSLRDSREPFPLKYLESAKTSLAAFISEGEKKK